MFIQKMKIKSSTQNKHISDVLGSKFTKKANKTHKKQCFGGPRSNIDPKRQIKHTKTHISEVLARNCTKKHIKTNTHILKVLGTQLNQQKQIKQKQHIFRRSWLWALLPQDLRNIVCFVLFVCLV